MVSLARCRLVSTSVSAKRPAAVALLFALTACGGGGGTSGVSPSTPISLAPSTAPGPGALTAPDSSPAPASPAPPVSPAPASPAPGAVIAVPAALNFDGVAAAAQSVTLRQSANAGGFVLSSQNCGGIASVSTVRGPGPFVFTPVAAGTCSYLATGSGGATAAIAIVVTTTTIAPK